MKQFARIFCLILFIVYLIFVYQNMIRLPMQDTQGGYLSLDMYFFGVQMGQPISVPILLGIAFVIGVISYPLIRYIITKDENLNDFYADDY